MTCVPPSRKTLRSENDSKSPTLAFDLSLLEHDLTDKLPECALSLVSVAVDGLNNHSFC